jgi:GTP cyclohydrolase II
MPSRTHRSPRARRGGSSRSPPRARLPTRHGAFELVAHTDAAGKEHAALVVGDVAGREDVPVRVHSECLTGDVFGSLRCDCRQQLEASIRHVQQEGLGVILYLRQEGRGIGLANKVRAYALQEQGLDTNEANLALGFRADERTYEAAAEMLRRLGVRSVRLLTNNPDKVRALQAGGIRVTGRVPVVMPANPANERYLRTKRESGHLLGDVAAAVGATAGATASWAASAP